MRRLHQTLADYVVIAISPALIMTLVGSLVYFLLAIFYQGQYQERLHWVMACFVFAAVLISRISIEEGFERAVLFGAPLAILVGIAATKFMEYHDSWIDDVGWLVNFAIIGIIWWCAHKLTWDCTVIDEAQDSSGEGLMQITGLERPADERNAESEQDRRLEGTTQRQVPASYWERYVEHQRRPHAPGVWVVYFSLAALPIFGFGGWLIPASDAAGRRYVFWLLCTYVASGLGLLITTSFLGLRRYLRQRRIEMPTLMANLWLGTGAAIAVALLIAAALLPRPSAEYAVAELPFTLGSPGSHASRIAPSQSEGTEDDQPRPAAEGQHALEAETEDQKPTGQGNQPQGEAQGQDASSAESADSKSQAEGDADSKDTSEPTDRSSQSDQTKQESRADKEPAAAEDPEESQPAEESAQASDPPSSTPSIPDLPIGSPAAIFKWVFYILFALVVLYAIWRYRHDVLAAFRNFLAELRNWWDALVGRKRDFGIAADEPLAIEVPASPFSSFANPFAGGQAGRYSSEELVRYSFEAFEAWSREHGCPREPGQTPHELARDVARLNAFIAAEGRNLAELYAQAAYAKGALPTGVAQQLQQLWIKMQSSGGVRAVADDELPSPT